MRGPNSGSKFGATKLGHKSNLDSKFSRDRGRKEGRVGGPEAAALSSSFSASSSFSLPRTCANFSVSQSRSEKARESRGFGGGFDLDEEGAVESDLRLEALDERAAGLVLREARAVRRRRRGGARRRAGELLRLRRLLRQRQLQLRTHQHTLSVSRCC